MKRSNWKLPYIHSVLFKKRNLLKKQLFFRLRNSSIPKYLVDKRIYVYNGIWFLSKNISNNMVGHKVGEFAFTKRSDTQLHLKRKSKKKTKKK